MENFAAPARPIVARMIAEAAAHPERAVAFQGAPGANSHLAVNQAFPDGLPLPCFSFEDAIDAVRDGQADCAMIPIENSLHGRVADIHFLLTESGSAMQTIRDLAGVTTGARAAPVRYEGLQIVGEHFLPIRYSLMGIGNLDQVKEAISHPQALGQCRLWLKERGIVPTAYPDTADAAAYVAEMANPKYAALAPQGAAELYGLKLLASDIADAAHNMTRFVMLAREASPLAGDGPFITTLIFEVKNVPAALYKALGGFATNRVNMTKLESYQRAGSFAATEFYADIVGRPGEPSVDHALEELGFHSKWVRLLGTYPQARGRD